MYTLNTPACKAAPSDISNLPPAFLQDESLSAVRVSFLTRAYRLPPTRAALVADLHFGERG